MQRTLQSALAIATLAGVAGGVSGATIYTDHFLTGSTPANGQYTAGANLAGQNPTLTNASAAWTFRDDGGGTDPTLVNVRVANSGLVGNGSSGGSAESFRNGTGPGGTFILGRPALDNTDTTISTSEILYFSALVRFASGQRVGVGAQFQSRTPFGIGFDTDGKAGIYVGVGSNETGSFSSFQATINNPATAQPFAADTTYLIVGRMVPNTGATANPETIELLAVSPSNANEPVTALTSYGFNAWGSATTTDTIKWFEFLASKSPSGVSATADALRYGTSYADVVVVPEPATLGLAGIATMLIGRRRRA